MNSGTHRHSIDLKFFGDNNTGMANNLVAHPSNHVLASPPQLQNSYSTGDVPTLKGNNGNGTLANNVNNHAQQHFHNHNASLGRIPASAMSNRHSRELSVDGNGAAQREQPGGFPSIQSALQGSAAPFGPTLVAPAHHQTTPTGTAPQSAAPVNATINSFYHNFAPGQYGPPNTAPANVPGAYTVPLLNMGMQNLNVGAPYAGPNYPNAGYTSFQQRDSQARVIQHRRQMDNDGTLTLSPHLAHFRSAC
jgi:hypothetical protein